ncbi:helix-turn-helix domain-containing protein [Pseudonocardia sichuanensis]|uniref:Helix-turn-helix protein n=1 Tax=Pseudonocardia kunmingensis TaxID=630975 RepID=A0A543E441_9PSEU|nr:helix-turn-helix transcriptional regulator [Pseudonocardia kunmingensis]TQM16350.1 helix-turn-helix protein [Pseudonocardia kunmingensis]
MAENALGAFLRSRREAISPTAVGLPVGTRRRTPGLRREELAALAGISVEYLTRLERGRDRRPSAQVVGALADALGLTPDERVHVHRMVKTADAQVCPQATPPPRTVRPTVLALLDRLEPTPALVVDPQYDVLACTAGFRRLAGPVGLLDGDEPNLVRFTFADARARAAFPDWEGVADERAAALRAAADLGDRAATALAEELSITVGTEFGHRYAGAAVLPAWAGVEQWEHPTAGLLRLAFESLPLPGPEEQRLIIHLPADAATQAALTLVTNGTLVGS